MQLLWFIGTALCRSRKSAAAAADDVDAPEAAAKPSDGDENVMLADLGGCGFKLLSTVRKELHALLDAVSMQVRAWCFEGRCTALCLRGVRSIFHFVYRSVCLTALASSFCRESVLARSEMCARGVVGVVTACLLL